MHRLRLQVKDIDAPFTPVDGLRVWCEKRKPGHKTWRGWHIHLHLPDLAPPRGIRQELAHDPRLWEEFRRDFAYALAHDDRAQEAIRWLRRLARHGRVTLLYKSLDKKHNAAVIIRDFVEGKHRRHRPMT